MLNSPSRNVWVCWWTWSAPAGTTALVRIFDSRERRTKAARFGLPASIEDLNLSPARGLERSFILELAQGEWIRRHLNILVLGPTGAGKTYLACALGQAACRYGFSVRYYRTSRLLHEIMLSPPMDPSQSSWPAWPGCSC